MDRKTELLKAAYDLLKQAEQDHFVRSAMEITVHYDDAECDGNCLLEDIGLELGIDDA